MGERRPIATRELSASKWLASRLAAAGFTPNAISVLGMVAGGLSGIALFLTALHQDFARTWFVVGAVLVQLRLLANMLDGMVAVENDLTSPVGELYNEVPDRVSDVATLLGLGFAAGGHVELGFLAALAAVATAYVRAQVVVAGGPQDFVGPLAKPQRMFLATVTALYCGLTPGSWQPVWAGMGLPGMMLLVIAIGSAVTAVRRLLRGATALRGAA